MHGLTLFINPHKVVVTMLWEETKHAGLLLKPKVFLYCAKYTDILFVISFILFLF